MANGRDRDRDRGGGGGTTTICPYCARRIPLQGPCPNQSEHGPNPVPKYRECGTCGKAAPIGGECLNCKQNRGKGQKPPQCPGCKSPLPPSGECQWCGRMWHCKACDSWLKVADHKVCPTCSAKMEQEKQVEVSREAREDKQAKRTLKRELYLAKCKTCDQFYRTAEGDCPNCTVRCNLHNLRHPKGQACPKCSVPVKYELRALADGDDRNQRWELSVVFLKTVGSKHPEAIRARVRMLDSDGPSDELDVPDIGHIFHAPYRVAPRMVKFLLVNSYGEKVAGIFTKELELRGKPVKFQKTQPRPNESPWDAFLRALKGERP